MINKDDLVSLSYEKKVRYRAAINSGYFDNYERDQHIFWHTLVGYLLRKSPKRTAVLNRLKDILGHIPTWDDMSDDVLRDFVYDLTENMAASSARTMCAELKAVLNANKRKIPSEDFREILSLRDEVSQSVYLTREEILRIIAYTPVNRTEQFVRRNFLVGCMTGARRCDAERLTTSSCDIDTGMLTYVPQKTPGIKVSVPVDERMRLRDLLIDEYRRQCDPHVFNHTLRRICRECRIDTPCTIRHRGISETKPKYEFVSSHTARRSFATNLYLAGISLEDIAMLMGHGKNIETTKRYICAERQMSSNVLAYFQQPQENKQQNEYED